MKNRNLIGWFLFGLGTQLQIVASLSFTELFVFAAAPLLYFKELPYMKRNGIMPLFFLSLAVFVGCIIAIFVNHTEFIFALRGLAVTSLLPCTVVVCHWVLRRDMSGFKWMLLGSALSSVMNVFVFQSSVELTMYAGGEVGASAVQGIMSGPLFWVSRIGKFITLFPRGWYMQCPTWLAAAAPLFMAGFSMLTSVSGRSAALGAMGSAALVILGGKKRATIRRGVCLRFWILVVIAIIGCLLAKFVYETSAEAGWLGEDAQKKYEIQTHGDKSLKALLLGGRMESFCGLLACFDNPIIGFGPWPVDRNGYTEEFLGKYATNEDYQKYINQQMYYHKMGLDSSHRIPCHAHLTEFWCWYGVSGLIFWLYVIFVIIRYLKQDCWAVPQWFMWLAAASPEYLWGVFFSPWAARITGILFIVACLMVRAVRKGAQQLPQEMIDEIRKREMR